MTGVSFSLLVTVTLLVKLPTKAVLTVTNNSIESVNSLIFQVKVLLSSLIVKSIPLPDLVESTNSKPSGNSSTTLTTVALTREVLFTTIVKVTSVLLPVKLTSTVLLTVKTTGTTSIDSLSLTLVLFSLHVTLTTFVMLPATLVFTVTLYQMLTSLPFVILDTIHSKSDICSIFAPLLLIMPQSPE